MADRDVYPLKNGDFLVRYVNHYQKMKFQQ